MKKTYWKEMSDKLLDLQMYLWSSLLQVGENE